MCIQSLTKKEKKKKSKRKRIKPKSLLILYILPLFQKSTSIHQWNISLHRSDGEKRSIYGRSSQDVFHSILLILFYLVQTQHLLVGFFHRCTSSIRPLPIYPPNLHISRTTNIKMVLDCCCPSFFVHDEGKKKGFKLYFNEEMPCRWKQSIILGTGNHFLIGRNLQRNQIVLMPKPSGIKLFAMTLSRPLHLGMMAVTLQTTRILSLVESYQGK